MDDHLQYVANIVSAYVAHNALQATTVPQLIKTVSSSLRALAPPGPDRPSKQEPAIPIRKSVTPDFIISLEDGTKLKSLKRHLSTRYGMTPEQYRAKWGLPADYPMVAPNYSNRRSVLAKELGLGKKRGAKKGSSGRPRS